MSFSRFPVNSRKPYRRAYGATIDPGTISGGAVSSFNGRTGEVVLDLADVTNTLGYEPTSIMGLTGEQSVADFKIGTNLNNVDNTSDLNKPISTATQAALDLKLDDSQATAFGLSLLGAIDLAAANSILANAEGTFLPDLMINAVVPGDVSYSTRLGRWTKRGRLVFFEVRIILTSKGASTGALSVSIANIPHIPQTTGQPLAPFNIQLNNVSGFTVPTAAMAASNGTRVILNNFNGSTAAAATDANLTNTSAINIAGCYVTT